MEARLKNEARATYDGVKTKGGASKLDALQRQRGELIQKLLDLHTHVQMQLMEVGAITHFIITSLCDQVLIFVSFVSLLDLEM
jgi:hypothetical protein